MNLKKIATIGSVVLMTVLLVYGFILARQIFSDNTKFSQKELYVYIPTGSNYEDVKNIIEPFVIHMDRFEMVAEKRSYSENIKPGRFLFTKGMNSYDLVRTLRLNVPVNLAFNNQERIENLAGRIGSQIEADSLSLLQSFKDSIFLKENGLTPSSLVLIFKKFLV